MNRPSLALAMIVKNEVDNLPGLLASVRNCVDEIHITDTGSTDGTIELAKALGATVHHFEWCNDFSKARNASFAPIKTDYTFWLDGDDILQNEEGFLRFRDTVMELADFWMAPYHYSSDPQGRPLCTFARERIIRTRLGMKWQYPIHEGISPQSYGGPLKIQYTQAWSVKHMRSAADLEKDRSRNVNIFEHMLTEGGMDSRMLYYYGKELFEIGRPKDSMAPFSKALTDPKLELHDRILAMQYLCYAYMQTNQFEQAIQLAGQGTILCPNRAEFYGIIGDCYIKMNQFQNAIPAYSAAKNCTSPSGGAVIFHTDELYNTYPRNQLSRIYMNLGDFRRGRLEAAEAFRKFRTKESEQILKEIREVKRVTTAYKTAKECDDIVISCPPNGPYSWDADIAKEKSMGGSETAAIEMAYWLHKLSGRPVKIFNMRKEDKVCDGVEYYSTDKLVHYMSENKPFLHIAWRHNIKVTDAPTFLWCHDLITPGAEAIDIYERILALTPFHKRYLMTTQGLPEHKILVTRNGIKPERFLGEPVTKNPNKIVFPSSPDRGLDRAILVLDEVRKTHPDVELHVFYGIEHLHKYGLQGLADKLKAMMDARPWVKYHGATQQDVLIQHFKEAAIWLHPCDFIETSCITAMEMVCSGVYPVTRKLGGLMDTLSRAESLGMATLIPSDCVTPAEFQLYIEATKKALDEKAWERVKMDANEISWESVAKSWLEELPKLTRSYGSAA